MVTLLPAQLNNVYGWISPHLKSEQRGGIVNSRSPGYHTSLQDLVNQGRSTNYSIIVPADRRGDSRNAAGIDITFGDLAELIRVHARLRKACTPDADGNYDPRIECVREIIGTLDGRNVSGYNRVSTGTGNRSRVGWVASGFSDPSHLWHEHISCFRDRVNNENEMRGLAEVIAGLAPGTLGWKDRAAVIPIEEPVYLPPHWVDPTQVSTFLYGVDHTPAGRESKERPPGYVLTTGVRVITIGDHKWLLTEAGYRYRMDFLTTTKPAIDAPVPTQTIVVGTCNIYVGNSVANGKKALDLFARAGADAVGFQELSEDADQKALTAYAKSIGWAATTRNSAVTTFYRTATTQLVKESYEVVEKGGRTWEAGAGGGDSIYKIIMTTVFRDVVSGDTWELHNQHIVPTIEKDGRWRANPIRVEIAQRQFRRLAENLGGSGSRLSVATGDMNVGWGDGPASDWCEKLFDSVGATVCWDEFPDKPTHGDRVIDWIVARNGAFVDLAIVPIPGSDHKGAVATIRI